MAIDQAAPDSLSAKAIIQQTLDYYGLGGLGQWAWNRYLESGSVELVTTEMRSQPEYKRRFPYMEELAKQGRAINEQEAISYERSVAQVMQAYGIPKAMYDQPDDFAKLITSNVSVAEVEQRVLLNQRAFRSNAEVRDAFRQFYGPDADGLGTAYWLDPDRAQPVLEQQLLAAEAAGFAERTKFGSILQEQAERLAKAGYDASQLMQGFSELAGLNDLRDDLVGESDRLDPDTLIRAQFEGDATAQRAVSQRQQRRQAAFGGGGEFLSDKTGFTGIGAAD